MGGCSRPGWGAAEAGWWGGVLSLSCWKDSSVSRKVKGEKLGGKGEEGGEGYAEKLGF